MLLIGSLEKLKFELIKQEPILGNQLEALLLNQLESQLLK